MRRPRRDTAAPLTFWSLPRLLATMVVLAIGIAGLAPAVVPIHAVGSSNVVISQVYGGGGNTGATLKQDFIELYNRGSSPVTLSGWSVQYASTAGTTWAVTTLSGTILPGGYYLIGEGFGAGGTVDLPATDATGTIAMSANNGKVALVNSTTTLTGSCPTGPEP